MQKLFFDRDYTRIYNIPNIKSAINSTHTTEKSFTYLLTTKERLVTVLIKQIPKMPCMKQILVRKTFKKKLITAYQKQNLKQDIRTIKNPSTTKTQKL